METRSQAFSQTGKTWLDLIKDEHRIVETLYGQYKSTFDLAEKGKIAHQIIKELSMHAAKEEMAVYPMMRKKLGDQAADHSLQEHQGMKDILYELDGMTPSDPGFDSKLELCMSDVTHHVQEEETQFLPKLQQLLMTDESEKLTRDFISAQSLAPTRPHPAAPNEGAMASAANMTAKGLDAMRDTARSFSGRPDVTTGRTDL
jgi:hemerythrin superfamily protein